MTEREALKLALEALENFGQENSDVCKAIKEALAQPEHEPCRHRIVDIRNEAIKSGYMCMDCGALFGAYTTPPQRTWVGLTDEDISILDARYHHDSWRLIKEAEAKLKEKNT